jgi:hypothetical protein
MIKKQTCLNKSRVMKKRDIETNFIFATENNSWLKPHTIMFPSYTLHQIPTIGN